MARTPSTTAEECEAILGPRGELTVHSENRGTVQKWLVARGVPAVKAKSMRLSTLAKCYNAERYLAAVLNNTADEETAISETPPLPEQPAPTPQPVPRDVSAAKKEAADHLAAALKIIAQGGSAMDEARVIELIRQHAPAPEPAEIKHVLEIKREDAPAVTVQNAHPLLGDVIEALSLGLNVAIIGPAGCGKTHIAEQAAEALSLPFYMTGAVDSRYELSGFINAAGQYVPTVFRQAFEHGGIFAADEMDGSDPGAFLWLNAALANGQQPFPDAMVKRHPDFRMVGLANTFGHGADRIYVGRNQLDAASLDRFKPQIEMDYDADLETHLCGNPAWAARVQAMRTAARDAKDRVVLSMRASIVGAKLIAKGWAVERVEDACLFAGIDPSVRQRLRAAAGKFVTVKKVA